MYFDQLLLAACKVHVVYFDQLLSAARYIHFISNHDRLIANVTYFHILPLQLSFLWIMLSHHFFFCFRIIDVLSLSTSCASCPHLSMGATLQISPKIYNSGTIKQFSTRDLLGSNQKPGNFTGASTWPSQTTNLGLGSA